MQSGDKMFVPRVTESGRSVVTYCYGQTDSVRIVSRDADTTIHSRSYRTVTASAANTALHSRSYRTVTASAANTALHSTLSPNFVSDLSNPL
jgi:hypothetical protein